jgi:hypothetical protein
MKVKSREAWGSRAIWSEHFAGEALFVNDAELHRADDALWAHDEVTEAWCAEREQEELHGPRGLWVDQGVEEDDVVDAAGVADGPVHADWAA